MDPANMKSERTTLNEVKNGRLAMLAFVGMCSGAAVYGKGPIELLQMHLADPAHNNSECGDLGFDVLDLHAARTSNWLEKAR